MAMKKLRVVTIVLIVLLLTVNCQQQPLQSTTVAENVFFAWPRKDTTVFFRQEAAQQGAQWSIWSIPFSHGKEIPLSSWPYETPINPIVSPSGDNVLVWQLSGQHLLLHLQDNQVSWSPLKSGFLTWSPDGEDFLGYQGSILEPRLSVYDFAGVEQRRLEQASLNFGEFLKNLMERNHCSYNLSDCYWVNDRVVFILARVPNDTSQPKFDGVSLRLDDFSVTDMPAAIQGRVQPSPNGERWLCISSSSPTSGERTAFVYDPRGAIQVPIHGLNEIRNTAWSRDSDTLYCFLLGVDDVNSHQKTSCQIVAFSMVTGEKKILYTEAPAPKFYPFLQDGTLVYTTQDDQLLSFPLPMP